MSHPDGANFNDPTVLEARLQKRLRDGETLFRQLQESHDSLTITLDTRTREADSLIRQNADLRERVRELEKDKERLDWLNQIFMHDDWDAEWQKFWGASLPHHDLRESVDAARCLKGPTP